MAEQNEATQPAAEKAEETAAAVAEEAKKPQENGTGTEAASAAEPVAEEPPKEMRAVVLAGFGGLKTVKILKKPEPTLGEGEVLIRVKAW